MFDGSGDGSATRRVPDAPIPVLVVMDELWPRETITIRGVSLGVRAYGLRVDGLWPGLLSVSTRVGPTVAISSGPTGGHHIPARVSRTS